MTKEEMQNRITVICEEIKKLEDEKEDLERSLNSVLINDNTLSLLNEIIDVNRKNSIHEVLDRNTKTTPIMDKFDHSDMRFLVFDNQFELRNNSTTVSLVVVKRRKNIIYANDGLTMTDLKSHDYYLSNNSKHPRFKSLVREVFAAYKKVTTTKNKIPFEIPVRLGGQTSENQTGFGSIWEGYYQVKEGTLYGETTGFYIIGAIFRQQ